VSTTPKPLQAAIEAARRIASPETAEDFAAAFKALGVSHGVVNEVEGWTADLAERRRVFDFLSLLYGGLDEMWVTNTLGTQLFGRGRGQRAIPGELREMRDALDMLFDAIERLWVLHVRGKRRLDVDTSESPSAHGQPEFQRAHVYHPGLRRALPYLIEARKILREHEQIEWDTAVPERRKGRKRDIPAHRLHLLGAKSARREDVTRALKSLLLGMHRHPDRTRAGRLATQLVEAVYDHAKAEHDKERKKWGPN